ncbi:MAG: hypothetical protein A2341_17445 [Deltaproteobacteria bacterium RIFOXYB12_FULL_58_9]|nr:MAG: hypothetical protein A2341_17445 [Deltaproteobacteria bacterium RIFOXYB12_FULL_58_9]
MAHFYFTQSSPLCCVGGNQVLPSSNDLIASHTTKRAIAPASVFDNNAGWFRCETATIFEKR